MAQQHPKVSVVIPVYNVSDYLNACVESVVKQSYRHLEIILVDDGSTDDSGKKCDEWAAKDARIQVVHKKNEGLNYARKSGWEVATGEYITFLDSDDLFHHDNIRNTLSVLQKEKVDMVICMYLGFSDQDEREHKIVPEIQGSYDIIRSTPEIFSFLLSNNYDHVHTITVWGKLYKKTLVDHVDWKQSNMRAYEDMFFTPQILDQVASFAILKQQLYLYRQNNTGVVLSKMLTGNHRNGIPVGYLEYVDILKDYWHSFLKKHGLKFNKELDDFWLGNMHYRLNNLLAAGLLCEENNVNYISKIFEAMQKKSERSKTNYKAVIESQAKTIQLLESELHHLQTVRGSLRNIASRAKHAVIKKK